MALPSFLTPSTWQVVTGPVVALGGALLAGGALLWAQAPLAQSVAAPSAYRLTLHTDSARACYYGSAWNEGEVLLTHDAADGRVVTLSGRYDFEDGCTWEAIEVLTPSASGYAYSYSERPVRCAIGATPAVACSRVGTVDVTPAD